MLPLPTGQFKIKGQRGFIYTVLKRVGDIAIAEQYDTDLKRIVGYEVFVVQKYPDRWSPDGKVFIPAKESAPPASSWGALGFTCGSMEHAEIKMEELLKTRPVVIAEVPEEIVEEEEPKETVTKKKKAAPKKKK